MTDKFTDYFSFIISLPFFHYAHQTTCPRVGGEGPSAGGFLVMRPDEAAAAGLWAVVKGATFERAAAGGSGIGTRAA